MKNHSSTTLLVEVQNATSRKIIFVTTFLFIVMCSHPMLVVCACVCVIKNINMNFFSFGILHALKRNGLTNQNDVVELDWLFQKNYFLNDL